MSFDQAQLAARVAEAIDRVLPAQTAVPADSAVAPPAPAEIAALIDHTLLKPDAVEEQLCRLCDEAKEWGFASVCVNPGWVSLCQARLEDSPVRVCTVAGFPLGATTGAVKAFEAAEAVRNGADEVDMVINVGRLKDGDYAAVFADIAGVVQALSGKQIPLKVILETPLLSDREKVAGSLISKLAGASFVKTATGFGGGGATVADITLMRATVGATLGVKASGGIRSATDALSMVAAGATRIGASAGIAIMRELSGDGASSVPSSGAY